MMVLWLYAIPITLAWPLVWLEIIEVILDDMEHLSNVSSDGH